jgi:hypothetical protein
VAHSGLIRGERGQSTVEWVGLVLLVALLFGVFLAALAGRVPGTGLVAAIYGRLACAIQLSDACSSDPELAAAYGPDLASLVRSDAPEIRYEEGMSALPVDFRACRGPRCGNGPEAGAVSASDSGQPAAAFVHVVDCRPEMVAETEARGLDCSGSRAGNAYVQYWLYYEDSTSLGGLPAAHHEDDWESYQVRITPEGTDARASSHHGYNYGGGAGNWLSDAGVTHRPAWGPATGSTYVSGGSHAGHVQEDDWVPGRWTAPGDLELIPIETLDAEARRTRFAIVPPWRKPVYRDPEDEGT